MWEKLIYKHTCICVHRKQTTQRRMKVLEGDYPVNPKDFNKKKSTNKQETRELPSFSLKKKTAILNQRVFSDCCRGSHRPSTHCRHNAPKPARNSHSRKLIAQITIHPLLPKQNISNVDHTETQRNKALKVFLKETRFCISLLPW